MEKKLGHRVSAKRLKDCAWVCNKIERSRRQDLSFEHHQLVAGVKPASEQGKWLSNARKKGWKPADLKRELAEWRKNGEAATATRVVLTWWQDVDLDQGRVSVSQTLVVVSGYDVQYSEPKSEGAAHDRARCADGRGTARAEGEAVARTRAVG